MQISTRSIKNDFLFPSMNRKRFHHFFTLCQKNMDWHEADTGPIISSPGISDAHTSDINTTLKRMTNSRMTENNNKGLLHTWAVYKKGLAPHACIHRGLAYSLGEKSAVGQQMEQHMATRSQVSNGAKPGRLYLQNIYIYINMEMKVLNVLHESLLSHLLATWVII